MTIALNQLRFYAFHGALPQERTVGGDYLVDLSVEVMPTTAACELDELGGTINYAELYAIVEEEMRQPANLLEHLAWRIGQRIRTEYPLVEAVRISITKCNPPIGASCQGATVTLEM